MGLMFGRRRMEEQAEREAKGRQTEARQAPEAPKPPDEKAPLATTPPEDKKDGSKQQPAKQGNPAPRVRG